MTKNSLAPKRTRAFNSQDGHCTYCGLPMCLSEKDRHQFARQHGISLRLAALLRCTAEHLVAKRDGGDDSLGNITAACLYCNRLRHRGRVATAPSAEDYQRHVRERVSRGKWHPAVGKLARKVDAVARRGQRPSPQSASVA